MAAPTMKSPRQQAEMFTRADQHDQQAADLDDDDPPPPAADSDLPRNTPPEAPSGAPNPKAQRNFTDPDSRIMFRDGTYVQAYNAQIAVDEGHQIIVAGAEYLEPVLRRVVDNCDCVPDLVAADAGYFSAENVRAAEQLGSEPFFAVGRHRNDGFPDDSFRAPSLDSDDRQRMRAPRDRAWTSRSCTPQGHRLACLRAAKVRSRHQAEVVSRHLEGSLRMAADLRHSQSPQAPAGAPPIRPTPTSRGRVASGPPGDAGSPRAPADGLRAKGSSQLAASDQPRRRKRGNFRLRTDRARPRVRSSDEISSRMHDATKSLDALFEHGGDQVTTSAAIIFSVAFTFAVHANLHTHALERPRGHFLVGDGTP